MYEAYFTRRLLQALTLANEAADAEERSIHLRASKHYRELLKLPESRRSPRHGVRIAASLRQGPGDPQQVVVSDLSTSGFRIEAAGQFNPGALVSLQMDGLAPVDACVVWQEGTQVGCRFLAPLNEVLLDAALAVSPRVD